MNTWFRRVRLDDPRRPVRGPATAACGLSRFYALFQVGVACALLGFGNFVAYKIASSIVAQARGANGRPPTAPPWTATHELKRLETAGRRRHAAGRRHRPALDALRDRHARGELHSYITVLPSLPFYLGLRRRHRRLHDPGRHGRGRAQRGAAGRAHHRLLPAADPDRSRRPSAAGPRWPKRVPREMFDLFGGGRRLAELFIFVSRALRQPRADPRAQPQHGHLRLGEERVRRALRRRVRRLHEARHDRALGLRRPDRHRAVRPQRPGRSRRRLGRDDQPPPRPRASSASCWPASSPARCPPSPPRPWPSPRCFVRNFWRHLRPDTTPGPAPCAMPPAGPSSPCSCSGVHLRRGS
jgi:hypothetical protein